MTSAGRERIGGQYEGVVQELRVFGLVRRGAVVFIIIMMMMIL